MFAGSHTPPMNWSPPPTSYRPCLYLCQSADVHAPVQLPSPLSDSFKSSPSSGVGGGVRLCQPLKCVLNVCDWWQGTTCQRRRSTKSPWSASSRPQAEHSKTTERTKRTGGRAGGRGG
eukprot:2535332-Rhodomonas_salina.5